ncbi:hypothetical protein ACJX0J_020318 [Zea mays]
MNAGATYQWAMHLIFHDLIDMIVEVYIVHVLKILMNPLKYGFGDEIHWVGDDIKLIVLLKKYIYRLMVYIDFRDLNSATSKYEYHMPIADMIINEALGH